MVTLEYKRASAPATLSPVLLMLLAAIDAWTRPSLVHHRESRRRWPTPLQLSNTGLSVPRASTLPGMKQHITELRIWKCNWQTGIAQRMTIRHHAYININPSFLNPRPHWA